MTRAEDIRKLTEALGLTHDEARFYIMGAMNSDSDTFKMFRGSINCLHSIIEGHYGYVDGPVRDELERLISNLEKRMDRK